MWFYVINIRSGVACDRVLRIPLSLLDGWLMTRNRGWEGLRFINTVIVTVGVNYQKLTCFTP